MMPEEQVTSPQRKHQKSKAKTIRAPGSSIERVAQACDRCRSKKTRCDGKRPQCSQCAAVGFECKISDKLSRRAFPRGYTETLEERIRELEFENKKLHKLIDLKNEQVEIKNRIDQESTLTNENLTLLNKEQEVSHSGNIHHHADGEPCNCANSVSARPVSIAGSVDIDTTDVSDEDDSLYSAASYNTKYHQTGTSGPEMVRLSQRYSSGNFNDPLSFEQSNAPGAAAAISIQNKMRTQTFVNLANLVAMSIPRTTEETLFIASLLAKICNVHGFQSKAPILTAKSIALLKDKYNYGNDEVFANITLKNVNFNKLTPQQSQQFFQSLNLPNQVNLDLFITTFFNTWNNFIPIINRHIFMSSYIKFNKSRETMFTDNSMFGNEKFGEILLLITTMVMLSQERNNNREAVPSSSYKKDSTPHPHRPDASSQSNVEILQYYDHLIHEFIKSNISDDCSLPTLESLSLQLLYCLAIGDLTTSYELRGKIITMGQQLRLHRCPSAVLGTNGSKVSQMQQGERRILFWCIYILDTFSALILGVPRLLKDYEIECALPFSNESNNANVKGSIENTTNTVIINNIKLSLAGKVSDCALAVMRYSKVLGNILDSIFQRSSINNPSVVSKSTNITEETCLLHEHALDLWRRELSPHINVDLDKSPGGVEYERLSDNQLTILFLYYHAKILIYLPLMANESSQSRSSASYINIQQSTTSILAIANTLATKERNFYFLPLPVNLSREKVRLAFLSAKGSLEYARGGALFQESKILLASVINELKIETSIGMLGCLSVPCMEAVDNAMEQIMALPGKVSSVNGSNSEMKRSSSKRKSSPLRQDISGDERKSHNIEVLDSRTPSVQSSLYPQPNQMHHPNIIKSENNEQMIPEIETPGAINDIFTSHSPPGTVTSMKEEDLPIKVPILLQTQQRQIYNNNPNHSLFSQQPGTQVLSGQQMPGPGSTDQQFKRITTPDGLDSLMMQDFGVDASLGLPMLDFDFNFDFENVQNNYSQSNVSPPNSESVPSSIQGTHSNDPKDSQVSAGSLFGL
ncbi:hypothetical protein LJB42_001476 [Komagataella kurtzmanii]|nr:hypothetical protein LJB42_001476 [Komagataella kurtzmanii]